MTRETPYEQVQRLGRESAERWRKQDALIEARRASGIPFEPSYSSIPLSVGTFDCNGNGKGSGW